MFGFIALPCPQTAESLPLIASISASSSSSISTRSLHKLTFVFLETQSQILRNRTRFAVFSGKNDDGFDRNLKAAEGGRNGANGSDGGDDSKKERAPVFNFKWTELLLDPDPDNLLAVALTGLLAWASVQVLWQLFFISLAILVAALKYSFIAALLIFILITLL